MHRLNPPLLKGTSLVCLALLILRCGGGAPVLSTGTAAGEVGGMVPRLSSGTVTVYKLNAQLHRGDALGSVATDEAGVFTVPLPPYNGPLLVVASSGDYADEASGVAVKLDGAELLAVVADYRAGSKVTEVRVTAVSTLAAGLTTFHVQQLGEELGSALGDSLTHLDALLGEVDWRFVAPANLTTPGATSFSPEARAGLVLAAISAEARRVADDEKATAGLTVNAVTLTAALYADALDGTFDGAGPGRPLLVLNTPLSGNALRRTLGQGMAAFLSSARNGSTLSLADAKGLQQSVASSKDPYLFCAGQDPARCVPTSSDVEPPVITFLRPLDGAGVRGAMRVSVRAEDPSQVKALSFTAPSQLVGAAPTLAAGGDVANLITSLDVSSLPDGPLTLTVRAEDAVGNVVQRSIELIVANRAPVISFSSPSDGDTVNGTVLLSASATAQNGTLAKLEVLHPPPGMGVDTLPEAGSLAAAWNTKLAPEGLQPLTLRATDSLGAFSDATVNVTVDNLPPGTVSATLSAGAPIAGATVKLVAIGDATGLPATGLPGGPVLGQGGPTAADGTITFALTQENWDGPVQLVASGNSLVFLDPSDGTTLVSVPASLEFTSFLGHYRSGDPLSAPVTLWTTLADAAALAYAQGKNPAAPTPGPLSAALAAVDPLFSAHVSRPIVWNLRTATPVLLTAPPTQSLRDVVYAGLPDVALNQLARTISTEAGTTPAQVITAVTLTQQLAADLSDGQFDGKAGAAPLQTAGASPYHLDANTTRFRLATELDRFIRGAQNKTGLTRGDLQNAAVLDDLSNDASLLYPSGQPPIPFDNQPPTVTVTVAFTAADGSTGNPPVGASKLVAGMLTVTADATDASGVQSLDVRVGNAPLAIGQGNTPNHFAGLWATTGDGALTLGATATDAVGNVGTTDFTVTVDNTAPVVTVTQPAAGFYSQAVPIDASATDANGVVSTRVASPAGFVDQDAASSRVFGSWTIPAASADGPLSLIVDACDPVKNCVAAARTVTVDQTPPTLTVVGLPPPQFTNATSLAFSFTANDGTGAGVGAVKLKVGPTTLAATLSNGVWIFPTVPMPTAGSASIAVWAEDLAAAPNSGAGRGAPYELTYSIRVDRSAPAVSLSPVPSYFDERTLNFARLANGDPVMPVSYVFPLGQQPIPLVPGATVYKSGTRLGKADGNAASLNYAVAFDPAADAPLTAVLRWTAPCLPKACVSEHPLTEDLTRVVPGSRFFNLELTRENLEGRTGPMSLIVVFTDAAGNTTSRVDPITLAVVPPPVALIEDTAWTAAADPKSVFAYRLVDNSYANLFGSNGNFTNHRSARVVRYLVKNPAPYEVAANLEVVAGSQSIRETWGNQRVDLYARDGAGSFTVDGLTLDRYHLWDDNDPTACTDRTTPPPACTSTAIAAGYFPFHSRGSATPYECGAPSSLSGSDDVFASLVSDVDVFAFSNPLPSGNELSAATPYLDQTVGATRGAVVPAAAGTTPGAVAFYLEVAIPAARTEPLTWQTLPEDGALKYQYYRGDLFLFDSIGFSCATGVYASAHHTWRWNRFLNAATSNVNGSFRLKTGAPLVMSGTLKTPVAGTGTPGPSVQFNRSFGH